MLAPAPRAARHPFLIHSHDAAVCEATFDFNLSRNVRFRRAKLTFGATAPDVWLWRIHDLQRGRWLCLLSGSGKGDLSGRDRGIAARQSWPISGPSAMGGIRRIAAVQQPTYSRRSQRSARSSKAVVHPISFSPLGRKQARSPSVPAMGSRAIRVVGLVLLAAYDRRSTSCHSG